MPKISSSGTGLDIHRRVPVFRSPSAKAVGTLAAVSGAADTKRSKSTNAGAINDSALVSSAPGAHTARKAVKRSLNIPICEVTCDAEYEREVRPTYELPASYVKHVKKVGGEVDLSLEYVADRDDEVWLKSSDKSSAASKLLLSVSSFEAVVNILERFTAHSKELLPLINALKIVNDEFSAAAVVPGWDSGSAELVVPVVYHYWASKRARMGKPLCRRYWPAVTSSDTNPHQVFRTRDKEKYRLRRQHKRNDIIAFRKMQQLRREFSKATALVQLVLEREMLREAEFELQREVFDQTVLDLQQQTECSPVTRAAPYRYSLKNRDLIYDAGPSSLNSNHHQDPRQSLSASNVDLSCLGGGETSIRQTGTKAPKHGAGLPLKGRAPKHHTVTSRRNSATAASVPDSSSLAAAPLVEDRLLDAAAGAIDAVTSSRKKSDLRKRKRDLNNRGSQIKFKKWGTGAHKSGSGSGPGHSHASSNNHNWVYSGWKSILAKQEEYKMVSPDLLGPSAVCQPCWPSFMDDLTTFRSSAVDTSGSVSTYMSALELRVDDVTGAFIAPERYEARFRIGRGNRLVLDRVPVYANNPSSSSDCNTPSCYPPTALSGEPFRCIYPTSLYARYPSIAYNAFSAKLPSNLLPGPKGRSLKVKGRPPEAIGPPADSVINTERPNDQDEQSQSARITTTRLLPEIPMSNMKLINISHRNRQASSGVGNGSISSASNYKSISQQAKLSQRIATLPKVPPFNPPARLLLSAEKVQRLQQILAQSDSEDEKTSVEPTVTRKSRSTKA